MLRTGDIEDTAPRTSIGLSGVASLSLQAAATSSFCRKNLSNLSLSLVVHAIVLSWALHATMPRPSAMEQTAIAVEILQATAEPTPPAPQPAPAPEPVKSVVPLPDHAKPMPVHQPHKPSPRLAPEPAASAPSDAATVSLDSAPPSAPAPQQDAAPAAKTSSASAEDALRLYNMDIWARIQRHKPSRIRLRGTVTLSFSIARDGGLTASAISLSSGSDILDHVALDALRDAAPFPPPPGNNDGPMDFTIPFEFR